MLDHYPGAKSLETFHVQINGPGADIASAGQGDSGMAEPGKDGAGHAERSPHLLYQIVRSLGALEIGGVYLDYVTVGKLCPHPELLEHLDHGEDIADVGDVREDGGPLGEKRSRHDGQRTVLTAADPDFS
jgi:hypothetical protein